MATIPDQVGTPMTAISAGNVIVTWSEPSANGSPILAYRILFQHKDGGFSEELNGCEGTDSTIVSETQCTVNHEDLIVAPFSLTLGDAIQVKVIAVNLYGDSVESNLGGGASIVLVPDAPINIQNRIAVTDIYEVSFEWADGASDGG